MIAVKQSRREMRIARLQTQTGPRTAVVVGEAVRPLPAGIDVLDLLAADAGARERLAGRAEDELALDAVTLLAPLEPPTIRDFSVFEQHIEGAIKTGGDRNARVPEVWYERPYCYFSNPYAITGPGEDIRMETGTQALVLELDAAAILGR